MAELMQKLKPSLIKPPQLKFSNWIDSNFKDMLSPYKYIYTDFQAYSISYSTDSMKFSKGDLG